MNQDDLEKSLDIYDKAQDDAENDIPEFICDGNYPTNEQLKYVADLCKQRHEKHYKTRKVSLSTEINHKCICCGKESEIENTFPIRKALESHSECYNYASSHIIMPGYGSRYDMVEILIHICDKCLDKKIEDKTIAWIFNTIQ